MPTGSIDVCIKFCASLGLTHCEAIQFVVEDNVCIAYGRDISALDSNMVDTCKVSDNVFISETLRPTDCFLMVLGNLPCFFLFVFATN